MHNHEHMYVANFKTTCRKHYLLKLNNNPALIDNRQETNKTKSGRTSRSIQQRLTPVIVSINQKGRYITQNQIKLEVHIGLIACNRFTVILQELQKIYDQKKIAGLNKIKGNTVKILQST